MTTLVKCLVVCTALAAVLGLFEKQTSYEPEVCEKVCSYFSANKQNECISKCMGNIPINENLLERIEQLKSPGDVPKQVHSSKAELKYSRQHKRVVKTDASHCGYTTILQRRVVPCLEDHTRPHPQSSDFGLLRFFEVVGDFEPYSYFVYASFIETWAQTNPENIPPHLGNYSQFLAPEFLSHTLQNHCDKIDSLAQCVETEIHELCQSVGESFTARYMSTLKSRYCNDAVNGTRTVNQTVLDAMQMLNKSEHIKPFTQYLRIDVDDKGKVVPKDGPQYTIFQKYIGDYCDTKQFDDYLTMLFSFDTPASYILEAVDDLVKYGRSPIRCIISIFKMLNPQIDLDSLLIKYVEDIERATGGILGVDLSYFLPPNETDYGSDDRVSLMAVGDPHIRHLDATNFSLCNSEGWNTLFSSFMGSRVLVRGENSRATNNTDATIITSIVIDFYEPGADLSADPAVRFSAENGMDLHADNETTSDSLSVSISHDNATGVSTVIHHNTGMIISILAYRNFYNIVLRAARGYIETASGLLVNGCGVEAKYPKEALDDSAARKKRAAPTRERCISLCSSTPYYLLHSCVFDCVVMEDPMVYSIHQHVVHMEDAARGRDVEIRTAFSSEMVEFSTTELFLPEITPKKESTVRSSTRTSTASTSQPTSQPTVTTGSGTTIKAESSTVKAESSTVRAESSTVRAESSTVRAESSTRRPTASTSRPISTAESAKTAPGGTSRLTTSEQEPEEYDKSTTTIELEIPITIPSEQGSDDGDNGKSVGSVLISSIATILLASLVQC